MYKLEFLKSGDRIAYLYSISSFGGDRVSQGENLVPRGTISDERSDIDVAGGRVGREFHEWNLGLRARSGDPRRATRSRGAPSRRHLAPSAG